MRLELFTIWMPTTFGFGCFKIKAKSFEDAYTRLSKKYKSKDGFIEDEDGTSHTFKAILGMEETV